MGENQPEHTQIYDERIGFYEKSKKNDFFILTPHFGLVIHCAYYSTIYNINYVIIINIS